MNQPWFLILAIFALLVAAIVFLILSRRTQKATGLPPGKLIYSDTSLWRKVNKPYYDPAWGLAGKPDYVIDAHGVQIPVEVKSNSAEHPYDSHILQLAAYCRLVEVTSGIRPPLGLIKYANRVFEIEYSSALEHRLELLISEIRCADANAELPRSHNSAARCAGCGYRTVCTQRLEPTNSNSSKKI